MNPNEWNDIKGYEGRYEIRMIEDDPWVEIRSKTKFRKILTQYIDNRYRRVNLYKSAKSSPKRISVHRLVALQYIPNPENKQTINHINGIKTDNRIENLEWNSIEENFNHAIRNNLLKLFKEGKDHIQYKGAIGVYRNGELLKVLRGQRDIENAGFSNPMVYQCANGKRSEYKGYVFRWMERD